ncbi:hypothetical protein, partial [uncultured Paracoccus sp.]|uniref:hypothetical protein n=1 Tax=uncultured Paracoccus sp. TaxID=189685 RepID=UPI002629CF69
SATDKLGPPVSARPVVSYTTPRDIIPWRDGARWQPATFFVREPQPGQQVGDGGVVHMHPLGVSQRIAQLRERDVGVLCDKLFKECLMWGQLPLAARRSLRGRFSMTSGLHLACPSRSSCG